MLVSLERMHTAADCCLPIPHIHMPILLPYSTELLSVQQVTYVHVAA